MLAPVYGKYKIEIERAKGHYIYSKSGQEILDFYSGHGVISLGHQHPSFTAGLKEQLDQLVYYSNAVELPIQSQLDETIQRVSGLQNYQLFLCNSGAEAVENALKVAAFHNGRNKIVALKKPFMAEHQLRFSVQTILKFVALSIMASKFLLLTSMTMKV